MDMANASKKALPKLTHLGINVIHLDPMVKFYTGYWLANRDVLLDARIEAPAPLWDRFGIAICRLNCLSSRRRRIKSNQG